MIVTVSNERETEGWPPDPACWFLVRPFGAEDVLRALRAPVPPGPAARAPLVTRRRGAAREAASPPVAGIGEPAAESGAEAPPLPVTRLSSDDSLWEVDIAAPPPPPPPAAVEPTVEPEAATPPPVEPPPPAPEERPAWEEPAREEPAAVAAASVPAAAAAEPGERRSRVRSRRTMAEIVAAVILVVAAGFGGVAFGRATATADRLDVSAITPASGPSAPTATSRTSPPATRPQVLASASSCLSALDHSDAAISYLVGNIRDDRLSRSIQQYQADRRVCRERVR